MPVHTIGKVYFYQSLALADSRHYLMCLYSAKAAEERLPKRRRRVLCYNGNCRGRRSMVGIHGSTFTGNFVDRMSAAKKWADYTQLRCASASPDPPCSVYFKLKLTDFQCSLER